MILSARVVAACVTGACALLDAASGSATTIVNPILGGPFSPPPGSDLGTILAIRLDKLDTYDFTFTIAGAGEVLSQIQASVVGPPAVSEPIEFDLYSGAPGGGTYVTTTSYVVGPSLSAPLTPGSYYLEVLPAYIAVNDELLTGGLAVVALPEPAAWTLMLIGVGGVGGIMRVNRSRRVTAAA